MSHSKRRTRLNRPDAFPLVSEEHAASIGYVAIRWAAVEGAVGRLMIPLLNIELLPAIAIAAANPELTVLNMVTVLVNLSGDEEATDKWKLLHARHEELRPRRNDAIHAQWQVAGGMNAAFRVKGREHLRLNYELIETTTLDSLANDILALAEDITAFEAFLRNRRIHEPIFGNPPPGLNLDHYHYPTPKPPKPRPTPTPRRQKLSSAQKRALRKKPELP